MMARMPVPDPLVDTQSELSVSFAPPTVPLPLVAVGPGRPATRPFSHGVLGAGMNGYPIQPAKVQRPALRDETLARDRLLD